MDNFLLDPSRGNLFYSDALADMSASELLGILEEEEKEFLELYCHSCAEEVSPDLFKNGPHVQANCPRCAKYIKFVPDRQIRQFEIDVSSLPEKGG